MKKSGQLNRIAPQTSYKSWRCLTLQELPNRRVIIPSKLVDNDATEELVGI